jgi:hypothetical protein
MVVRIHSCQRLIMSSQKLRLRSQKVRKKVTTSIEFFPDQFDLSKSFVLPLRIASSSEGTLSAHFSVALLAVVVKNLYDGIYEITDGNIFRNLGGTPDAVLGGDYIDGP